MANKYQEAILNAVDYLVNNRISSIDRDKTITATIVACNNSITQEYKISYNGGYLIAYAQENMTYKKDATVFVLVPEGDFSKRKTILGLATSSSSGNNISFVSSLINDYNKIGENVFSNQKRWGLNSYKKEDYKLIYQHGLVDENFISVNDADLLLYMARAEALLLQGTFQTALPREHRNSSSGKYGVSFNLAFKNGDEQTKKYSTGRVAKMGVSDIEFSISETDFLVTTASGAFLKNYFFPQRKALASAWSDYQASGDKTAFQTTAKNIANQLDESAEKVGLSIKSYTDVVRIAEQGYEISSAAQKSSANILAHYIEYIQKNFSDDSWKDNCLEFLDILKTYDDTYATNSATSSLLDDLIADVKKSTMDTYEDILVNQETPAIKYVSYTLDSSNMLGNPMLYISETPQYNIFQIDSSNFLYIDSILLFSRNFVEKDDTILHKDNNIFFSDFSIFGLQKISSVSGDYVLRIGTPSGAVFKTTQNTEKLYVVGNLTKQNDDLSDTASFSWFVKDDRINSSSEEYRVIAGSGWRFLKNKGQTKQLELLGSENRAYENKYLCVVNYKESIILKSNFIIYNESCQRKISIKTNYPLTEFCVDRGIPEMTCTIDGKSKGFEEDKENNKHDDNLFTFCWSVTDNKGNTTTLNQTKEELELLLKEAREKGEGYSKLMSIQNAITRLENVTINRNVLIYPVSLFQDRATFSCSVFLREDENSESYFIGSAELVLTNNSIANPVDYSIRIENGDQVFQYSESGVTPASERYTDPQKILPLTCHFYDKQGIEVNSNTYTVKWRVPTSNSMIVVPTNGMVMNPATMIYEWYMSSPYPTDIKDSFDYQALHNQVTCIVTYQGIEYTQDTEFSFLKIGDNGTNGTDIVAKIYPKNSESEKLFAIEKVGESVTTNLTYNKSLEDNPLQFKLYRRNDVIDPKFITWEIAGKKSKHLEVQDGILSWVKDKQGKNLKNNQIVKATTTYTIKAESDSDTAKATSTSQTYNAFYPIPFIEYFNEKAYKVDIDRDSAIKQVLYNADGRNPMYNKKQGLTLSLGTKDKKKIVFDVLGGVSENADTSSLRLFDSENGSFAKSQTEIVKYNEIVTANDKGEEKSSIIDTVSVYTVPADVYSGEYSNQIIRARIYDFESNSLEVEVYLPVHLSLNTYGLASLNAWDGNHIEINEDGEYILAPQIGAGYKGKDPNDSTRDNVFTGIVMGQAKTYDDNNEKDTTGLLGYSGGKQSIFLDAVTGKAVFGLPSDAGSQENGYNEGRIKLVPGGNSQIGSWNIGSNAIYSAKQLRIVDGEEKWFGVGDDGDNDTTIANALDISKDPLKSEYNGNSAYAIKDASVAIPHDMQGAILSSFPAYLSIKGKPLNEKNSAISWGDANTVLKPNDSLEVEIDPAKSSLFSIYRHTCYEGDEKKTYTDANGVEHDKYHRYPLVGINSNGQFFTNAVENGESSMGIGTIGAFGHSAAGNLYVGGQFSSHGKNIFKFFVDSDKANKEGNTVYISNGSTLENEYSRDMNIYGRTISLYSNVAGKKDKDGNEASEDVYNSRKAKTSGHFFKLNDDVVEIGHIDKRTGLSGSEEVINNYLSLTTDNTKNNTLSLDTSNTEVKLEKNLTSTINGNTIATFNKKTNINYVSALGDNDIALDTNIQGNFISSTSGSYSGAFAATSKKDDLAENGAEHRVEFDISSRAIHLKRNVLLSTTLDAKDENGKYKEQKVLREAGIKLSSGDDYSANLDMHSYGGTRIVNSNHGGIRIHSKGVGMEDGICISAILDNKNIDKDIPNSITGVSYPNLKIYINSSSESCFELNSNKGSIWTQPDLTVGYPYEDPVHNIGWATASNFNGVAATNYYTSGVGIFGGTLGGQSDTANGSRLLGCSIYAREGIIAKKFMMDPNNYGDYMYWSTSTGYHNDLSGKDANNIQKVLEWLKDEIAEVRGEVRDYANSRANEAEKNAKDYAKTATDSAAYIHATDANTAAASAHKHANEAYSLAESKVSQNDFNNHNHNISYNNYTVVESVNFNKETTRGRAVSQIFGPSGGQHDASTSLPRLIL